MNTVKVSVCRVVVGVAGAGRLRAGSASALSSAVAPAVAVAPISGPRGRVGRGAVRARAGDPRADC